MLFLMVNYQQSTDETTKSNKIFSLNFSSLQSDQFSHHIHNLFVAHSKKIPSKLILNQKNVAMHQEHSSFSVSGKACYKDLPRG